MGPYCTSFLVCALQGQEYPNWSSIAEGGGGMALPLYICVPAIRSYVTYNLSVSLFNWHKDYGDMDFSK